MPYGIATVATNFFLLKESNLRIKVTHKSQNIIKTDFIISFLINQIKILLEINRYVIQSVQIFKFSYMKDIF